MSEESTVREQPSVYNTRALCITPNPSYRQGVALCNRLHRENPEERPPTTFQVNDPKVVV